MDTTPISNFNLPDNFAADSGIIAADAIVYFYNGQFSLSDSHLTDGVDVQDDDVTIVVKKPLRIAVVQFYGDNEAANKDSKKPQRAVCRHQYKIHDQAEIVETYLAFDEVKFEIENHTAFEMDDSATMNFAQTFCLGDSVTVKNELTARLLTNARLNYLSLNVGSLKIRNDLTIDLVGQNSQCQLQALMLAAKKHQIETVSTIRHLAGETKSDQLIKSVVNDEARVAFRGHLQIAKGAQKADANQLCQSLLLSREAMVLTEPQLDVGADDVKATHGATIGQLDEEELFYLISRGVSRAEARHVLAVAYQRDVIERVNSVFVKRHINEIHSRLPVELAAEREARA